VPTVARKHRWLEEGLATYLEPVVRARGGRLPPAEAWGILLDGLPRALPQAPAPGLDQSRTWASTYWGGALFAFLADVSIRERTRNGKGLRDALRGIQAAGGSIAVRWPLERVLEEGDAATGTTALRDLHARMSRRIEVDLPDLWKRLGVSRRGGAVALDDAAPLARVRRGITEGAKGRR
jgi:predicted metalloprotease with PDZ domain